MDACAGRPGGVSDARTTGSTNAGLYLLGLGGGIGAGQNADEERGRCLLQLLEIILSVRSMPA
jgi:hypothetical protein